MIGNATTDRAAYGLDTPRRIHWTEGAACARFNNPGVDPEWWWPTGNGAPTLDAQRAAHICQTHCPVRGECRRDAMETPPEHACIQGGIRYVEAGHHRTEPSRGLPLVSAVGCPYCASEVAR